MSVLIQPVRDLGRALVAETLKMKRTLALSLTFLAPLLVVALNLIIYWQRGSTLAPEGKNTWISLAQNNLVLWNLLMVPLFITLQTALLGGLEHADKNWKHVFALPVGRGAVYAAKQLVALAMIGLSSLVLWAGIIASGLALRQLRPGIGLEAPIPLGSILEFVLLSYVTSWLIIAIHTWVGMRWSSFVVAMSVGVAAMVAAVVIVQSDYGLYYPWTLPATLTVDLIRSGTVSQTWLLVGVLGGVVGAVLGGLDFTRRDVL